MLVDVVLALCGVVIVVGLGTVVRYVVIAWLDKRRDEDS